MDKNFDYVCIYIYFIYISYKGISFTLIKKLSFTTAWMKLENIMSRTEKQKLHDLTYMWQLRKPIQYHSVERQIAMGKQEGGGVG